MMIKPNKNQDKNQIQVGTYYFYLSKVNTEYALQITLKKNGISENPTLTGSTGVKFMKIAARKQSHGGFH